jgi:hypothetical protein
MHSFTCILCDRFIRAKRVLMLRYNAPGHVVLICRSCCARALDHDEPEQELRTFMEAQCRRAPSRYVYKLKENPK